ncbi:uncharacterized protein STEHIDRAFT_116270 [Stereum hirsutum FP-91666 SS1]|uniref:Uncharacterized protein n=1 Tax=Stereum hirsutum (strain FP-91666) TaxID=721885 RepID=R7RZP5_STEHR|nr:uncharacterized protein STEHIDRAFT_116270 [Stereum hirsutum FP-91666 SS1]EIM79787.1 hypothetical protein STEHIDRAFT_116270 [Stereum hirsutum FP-91666 SS1]
MPNRKWAIYPPLDLPSNNFSAVWEGKFIVSTSANGWIGLAIVSTSTVTLTIDDNNAVTAPYTSAVTILGNIEQYTWAQANSRKHACKWHTSSVGTKSYDTVVPLLYVHVHPNLWVIVGRGGKRDRGMGGTGGTELVVAIECIGSWELRDLETRRNRG